MSEKNKAELLAKVIEQEKNTRQQAIEEQVDKAFNAAVDSIHEEPPATDYRRLLKSLLRPFPVFRK